VHQRADPPVEKAVPCRKGGDVERTGGVVGATAAVDRPEVTELVVPLGGVPATAPLRTRYSEEVAQVPLRPDSSVTRACLQS
jgi:hypothetical protein